MVVEVVHVGKGCVVVVVVLVEGKKNEAGVE